MNNSTSSISTGSASYLTNPLKEDPELKALFKELETTVTSKQEFELWRNSFLNRFIEFLDVESTENAEQAYWKFSDTMSNFVRVINKLNKHMDDNNISPTHCSVKARQCLQEVSRYINTVNDEVDHLLPGTMNMEKEVGFTKFHIGAVLVRDGFREYARMSMCADVIEKMEKALKDVADKLILRNMSSFIYKLTTFCDVMADLGLLSALLKCSEYIDSDDDDEEPIKLSKLIDKMVNDDKNGIEIEYPNMDLNASITLFDRSNVSMNYDGDENVQIPHPSSQDLVLYAPTTGHETYRTEDALVPYSNGGTEGRIQISGRPRVDSYPSFNPDSSITLLDRSNTSLQHPTGEPNEKNKPLPVEFAPRASAPYEYTAPSSAITTITKEHAKALPKDFAPRESAPYVYVASKDVVEREGAPPTKTNPAGPALPKRPSSTNTESLKPPMHSKPPLTRRELSSPSSSAAATPNKNTVPNNDVQSPPATESDKKPSIGGRVRWNPVKYYNNIKHKPESRKVEKADTTKLDAQDPVPVVKEGELEVKHDSDINDKKSEEPERKGLRALFQRKATSKASPSDPNETEKEKESPKLAEPNKKNVEEKEPAQPADDSDDDDEKPIQRRRQKWSLSDIYKRLAKNKKEPTRRGAKKNDTKVDSPNEPQNNSSTSPDLLQQQRAKKQDDQGASVASHEPEIEADDVSESSTMVSDTDEPVKQVSNNKITDSLKQPPINAKSANIENHKERNTYAPAKPEKFSTTPETASMASKKSDHHTDSATKSAPIQLEKGSNNKLMQASKTSITSSHESNKSPQKPAAKQKAAKSDSTSSSTTEPEKPLTKVKQAAKPTKSDRPPEPTRLHKEGNTPDAPKKADKSPVTSTKPAKERVTQPPKQEKPSRLAKEPPTVKKDTPSSSSATKFEQEKRSDEVQKRVKNNHADKVPASPRKPVTEMKNTPMGKTTKGNNSNNVDTLTTPPNIAPVKSKVEKKKTKPQVEKKPLNVEQNAAEIENGSETPPEQEAAQTTKSQKKQAKKSPNKGVKSLFNKRNKKVESHSQPGESDEAVKKDRPVQSTNQNKPWDGVSTKLNEAWDENYTTKKKNGKGNEPLAICAAPPEDEDEERPSGMGGAPLLAICAAEPEEDEIRGGNGKPLLAICAAEPDDDDNDAESVDDVSESETMASDDEDENGILETEAQPSDDEFEEVDDVCESETAASELDEIPLTNDDADDDDMLVEGSAATQVIEDHTTPVTPTPHSFVDDVSESETAASDEEGGEELGCAPSASTTPETKDKQHTAVSTGTPTSNQSIATNTSAVHEKSVVATSQGDTTDTTTAKPHPAQKKEMKILTDEERRKCYMWYDRMGRPPRDKMKQRIPLMKDCDITVEDVDALPWMMRGTMISQSELNKLILK